MWVGGSSPIFANDDLLVAYEFELLLQKEETLEHMEHMEVSWFFLSGFFLYYSSSFSFDDDVITFFKEGAVRKKQYYLLL